jgi:F0F1-type ATP synthase assembly protein I
MIEPNKAENSEEKSTKSLKAYARYAGIGFQMVAVIGLFTFIGYKLDQTRNAKQPLMTALFSLAGVGVALYQVIKSVTKNKL